LVKTGRIPLGLTAEAEKRKRETISVAASLMTNIITKKFMLCVFRMVYCLKIKFLCGSQRTAGRGLSGPEWNIKLNNKPTESEKERPNVGCLFIFNTKKTHTEIEPNSQFKQECDGFQQFWSSPEIYIMSS
jgi:hypothetical protein